MSTKTQRTTISIARAIVEGLRDDPDALADLRQLVADTTPAGYLLEPDEVAARLRVSRRSVNRMAADGRLTATKVGRGWRFPADKLIVSPCRDRHLGRPQRARRPTRTIMSNDAAVAAIIGR